MAEPKTREDDGDVDAYIDSVENQRRREDTRAVAAMMARVTGEPPRLWGASIIGFGRYRYRYESGHEGTSFLTGVAPRKQALTVYIMPGFARYEDLMARLGRYRTGRSCLYINRLENVDMNVLEDMVRLSVDWMRKKHGA